MKFGLLGNDGQMAGVVAAAVARGDEVVFACDVPAGTAAVPPTARVAPWETLMDARGCDAVLVGGAAWNEARAEAVRKLVQAGRTLVLSQPLELSMLWAYEIDMIRKDSGARLIPCLPDRLHPFTARLRSEIEAGLGGGPLGAVETVDMTRRLVDRSRDSVLRHFARDADLVRVLVGEPQRLSTLGGGTESVWATLAVGLTGPTAVPVRWQVARGDPAGLMITVVGSGGTCTVTIPENPEADWTWTTPTGRETCSFDRGAAILSVLDAGAAGGTGFGPAAWDDAARAIELAETVPRSVAKGRAVDLHQEEFSELGTFRGTMASLGCGLVLAGLFVLLVATLVGGVAREAGWGLGERIAGAWPVAVLTALGLFLALQLLPLLVAPAARNGDERPPRPGVGT